MRSRTYKISNGQGVQMLSREFGRKIMSDFRRNTHASMMCLTDHEVERIIRRLFSRSLTHQFSRFLENLMR